MLDPTSLYAGNPVLLGDDRLRGLPMVVAMSGFVDAGHVSGQVDEVLHEDLASETLVRFDLDQLYDYRSRRPRVHFVEDHFEQFQELRLQVDLFKDGLGRRFLLLHGPEPDLQWHRFAEAVVDLARRLEVSLLIPVAGIPMAVPHTRPMLVTVHGNRTELLPRNELWRPVAEMSGSVANLLEIRAGEVGIATIGFSVHVPQYLADAYLPHAAVTALEHISAVTQLTLPTDRLREAAREVNRQISEQVSSSEEVRAVVENLERRYDDLVDLNAPRSLLAADETQLPDADEIGAAAEAFLAARDTDR